MHPRGRRRILLGIFSFLKANRDGAALNRYEGMRLEVLDRSEKLMFVAYAIITPAGMALRPLTNVNVERGEKRVRALLLGYDDETDKPVYLECIITERKDGAWDADDVKLADRPTGRRYHRQDIRVAGEVMPMRQNDIKRERCSIINASANGVCIRSDAVFRLGDRLLLTSSLLKEWAVSPLMITVRRCTKKGGSFEYGCEFVELTEETEKLILKALREIEVRRRWYEDEE